MTAQEILAAIKASAELRVAADNGQDATIATALSESLPLVPKPGTFIGERGIYAILGAAAGEAFLQTAEALAASDNPQLLPFKRIDRWLKDSIGLDIGNAEAHATLQSMTVANGGPFANEAVAAVLAYGSQRQSVSVEQVAMALMPHREGGLVAPINWGNV